MPSLVTIDFEASCLPRDGRSYPIEVGVADMAGWSRAWLIRPEAEWRGWTWWAEAQALLDSYASKRAEAEAEAQGIVAAAREEGDRLAKEATVALEALIGRRSKAVEAKIAQAEQQAIAEVRGRSADVAIEAARILLGRQMTEKGEALVSQAIQDVAAKLH